MNMFTKLFSGNSSEVEIKRVMQPTNFVECLDAIRSWNAQAMYQLDLDVINDGAMQAAMNTLVTCPYCSESYYFADALEFDNARLNVKCPQCHISPSEDALEEYVA